MSDVELRTALAQALERPVHRLERRPWPYTSSVPMEELSLPGAAPILFKDLTPRERPSRPAFLVDPLREIEAYTSLLDGLGAPGCHGAVVDERRTWLFLERVDGLPLWQTEGLSAWEAAARWAARLHAAPPPKGRHLLRYGAAFLRRWVERAVALAPPGALDAVIPAADAAIARLVAWPVSLIHGELYASNVLVEPDGRVRPVDWETVGLGPGLLDLAALLAGRWTDAERVAIVAAYRAHQPGQSRCVAREFRTTLDAARLLVALQWLGWSDVWSPPAEHRHDWLADARALAERLGP